MAKKKKSRLPAIILITVVIIAAVVGGIYLYNTVNDDINGDNQPDIEKGVILTQGCEQYQVGRELAKIGIVVNDTVWTSWMDKHYPDFEYIPGEYMMNFAMSYEEIAEKLKNPDVSHRPVQVCIPEGFNCMDIAERLEENKVCSADAFLQVCKSTDDFGEYEFLETVPDSELVAYQLEGFLFPATYDWYENMDPQEVAQDMLDAFECRITDEMQRFCADHDMTLYQLITLASIVQEEALGVSSAKKISSVFINRLNTGTKLQSDVTYFYAKKLRDEKGFSQAVYDAYYTYNCAGLPAGPITNCGADIVSATINYPKTDYMFFFSDLQQEFHFAKTYDEFMRLQQKYPWK